MSEAEREAAARLAQQLTDDVGDEGISALDVLDALATLGLRLVPGEGASETYQAALR